MYLVYVWMSSLEGSKVHYRKPWQPIVYCKPCYISKVYDIKVSNHKCFLVEQPTLCYRKSSSCLYTNRRLFFDPLPVWFHRFLFGNIRDLVYVQSTFLRSPFSCFCWARYGWRWISWARIVHAKSSPKTLNHNHSCQWSSCSQYQQKLINWA